MAKEYLESTKDEAHVQGDGKIYHYHYLSFHTKSISLSSAFVIPLLSGVGGRILHKIKKHFSVEKTSHV